MADVKKRATKDSLGLICGDVDIRIASDGVWFHEGRPILRKKLVKLFASVLKRKSNGEYWLITPAEQARIKVDEAPFIVVEMIVKRKNEDQGIVLRTNIDQYITVDSDHPVYVSKRPNGEYAPYLLISDGLTALINRTVYYQMAELCMERVSSKGSQTGIWSEGSFFTLFESSPQAN